MAKSDSFSITIARTVETERWSINDQTRMIATAQKYGVSDAKCSPYSYSFTAPKLSIAEKILKAIDPSG